jgi:hypothetical protein
MGLGITPKQRCALEQLAAWPRRWFRAGDLGDMVPRAAGMVLKGLYKRGMVDRQVMKDRTSASYRINKTGQRELA